MHLFYEQGLNLRSVSITAKDKICPLEKRNCDECPYGDNYYGRMRPALYELINANVELDKECFIQAGEAYTLCPFELSLVLLYMHP